MDLSVVEAAVLLGVQPRALRARLARGSMPGVKVDGEWRVRRDDLPMTEPQRARFVERAERATEAVRSALPEHVTKGRTLLDLDAFRWGAEAVKTLRGCPGTELACARLEAALVDLGGAMHTWERSRKLAALERARAGIGETAALVLLAGPPGEDPARDAVAAQLERRVAPAIAGLARWVAKGQRESA